MYVYEGSGPMRKVPSVIVECDVWAQLQRSLEHVNRLEEEVKLIRKENDIMRAQNIISAKIDKKYPHEIDALKLSDSYEQMPLRFQQMVPKTHLYLRDLMKIYTHTRNSPAEQIYDGWNARQRYIIDCLFQINGYYHCQLCY